MDQLSYESFNLDDDAAPRQRDGGRDSLLLAAQLRVGAATEPRQVRVRNLSRGGLMAEMTGRVAMNDQVQIEVRGIGWVKGHVAWIAEGRVGIAFDETIDPMQARKPYGAGQRK